jgi:dTDP-4-amino-4,6-dideoxygalactose transaminase
MKERYHYADLGMNSRLDTIQAAILSVKLKYLDHFNEARRAAADFYDKSFLGLNQIAIPERVPYSSHIFHQYTIRVRNGKRDALREYLNRAGIPSMIYYPGPLHMQEAYRFLGYGEDDFPITSELCSEVLSLPMHPDLKQDQLDYIVLNVLKFFEKQ